MKIILSLLLFSGSFAYATPVLEQAIGSITPYAVTIVPDDTEKNLYYFFPNHYGLSEIDNRKALTCMQSRLASRRSIVECNMIYDAHLSPDTLKKIQEISAGNPQSKFAPVPYSTMSVRLNKNTHPYLWDVECQREGSETGQQLTCDWKVKPSKFGAFRRLLLQSALIEVMQFSAEFEGIYMGKKMTSHFTIPIYISDLGKGDYFFDNDGNALH